MRFAVLVLLVLSAGMFAGCSDEPDVGEAVSTFENYQETGDLEALRERGYIRLLGPRFDEPSGLPREGIPASEYQAQAEAFVRKLGLEPRWVYADSVADLQKLLNEGAADIIVTNYSITVARKKTLAFSTAINAVEERLVVPAEKAQLSLKQLKDVVISVPEGTAYEDTANKLIKRYSNLSVEVLPAQTSNEELVQGVRNGTLQAAIVDDNLLAMLLAEKDQAAEGPLVNRKRRIAWAVRKNNPDLLEQINEFITHERIAATQRGPEQRDWNTIRKQGVLRVITSNNPASYFMWRGEVMGFDYELIRNFAKQHRLRVSVVVRDTPSELIAALKRGDGDLIAASMTVTPAREKAGWSFSNRYLEVHEQLIGRAGEAPLESVQQLRGRKVAVNPETAFLDTLNALKKQGIEFDIIPVAGATTEMLVDGVANGDYDLTLADSHFAAMETGYRDDIAVLHEFEESKDIAWVTRPGQKELQKQLNSYIARNYKGLFYNVAYKRYFVARKTIVSHQNFRVEAGKAISPYDDLVRRIAIKHGWDWRLITSQMYQESHFNPHARSFSGAQGLLQVMPRTGHQLGFSNLAKPENGVGAGVAYMEWLEQRFPPRLDLGEKLYFTLASYNAGHGHVEDARRLAERLGKNPDIWFGHVEEAMLLLSQPRYARQARYGYVRGSEPVKYVREIKNRYLGYVDALAGSNG